jgi:hypothetical protein
MRTDARTSGSFPGLAGFVLGVLLMPLVPGTLAGQAGNALDVVEVDLNGQTFNRALPFDVQFIFTGQVSEEIDLLVVHCWRLDNDTKTGKPILREDLETDDNSCWAGGPLRWLNAIEPTTPNPMFRVQVPPLDAKHTYQFRFISQVTPKEALAMEQKVRALVDSTLWRAGAMADLEPDAIQKQLIKSLKQVTGVSRFPDAAFNSLLLSVRDVQSQIDSTVEMYQSAVKKFNVQFSTLRSDSNLKSLKGELAVAAAPTLRSKDRESAAALSDFIQRNSSYFSGALANVHKLRTSLGTASQSSEITDMVNSTDQALTDAENALRSLPSMLDLRAKKVAAVASESRTLAASIPSPVDSIITGSTPSSNSVNADTGFVCAPELSLCKPYAGANFYTQPIDKRAPLRQFGPFFSPSSLSHRMSLTVGLTAQSIADSKTREDLFGSQSLVIGLGARLTNSVRLTAGTLVFNKLSPNPLSTDKKLTSTYFVSVSFDINMAPAFTGIANAFSSQ